ncbi:MAG: DUF2344 domain-containing protein [Butyrivibrio sp.]|uniref:TIGR03936 family radical SAM-associated protein n=1 Tax=Butyrivibrio sp. TaxID=28121 RepID=UPI001B27B634|nr:TIGR03936 family radical SAM-associated protein [Butyrivibrio sp.]MBO6242563.1 DUF2344 domain-containing protein [Butyrivibrio sp.]
MNKLRVKFIKHGPIKFVGHLDIMRYFQKAIRRAEIDIKYSKGFSPHQLLSFAQPLSVGVTSDGEYLDMTVNSMTSVTDVMDKLNSVMNEGIKIIAIDELDEATSKAMTDVYAARYTAGFRESSKPDFDWIAEFDKYLKNDKLPAMKKTKSGFKEIDMKHMVFDYKLDPQNETVDLLLSMSSSETLKPALLFEGFFKSLDKEFSVSMLSLHRVDIYKLVEDGDTKYIEPFIVTNDQKRFYLNG